MIHDDGKLTLEPVGERGRCVPKTGWSASCFAFSVRASPGMGEVRSGRGGTPIWHGAGLGGPTPVWHSVGLVSLAAGDFKSPLR